MKNNIFGIWVNMDSLTNKNWRKGMFSFVIRTKNEAIFLPQTLNAIREQRTTEKIEIIIVDSGSTDATLEIAKQFNCQVIKIRPEDFTWGYALNVGIQNAQGEYIGIISGHCVLTSKDFVSKSINILKGIIKWLLCMDSRLV